MSRTIRCVDSQRVHGMNHLPACDSAAPLAVCTDGHWPAGAQLYAGGELVGGCDIVEEMAAAGVLREELDEMAARV